MSIPDKVTAMRAGGKLLGSVREQLRAFVAPGTSFEEIEAEAQRLIRAGGATPNFALVPGYHWATCVMKNHELCHGIPKGKVVAAGDVITVDVGLLYQGFHLDTTTTFAVGKVSGVVEEFLAVGRRSLRNAIHRVRAGVSVYEISRAMEKELQKHGYGAVYQLTGHGIGAELHMDPAIPVFAQKSDKHMRLSAGQTIAVEVMYTLGEPDLELASDGWTYQTKDRSLSGMFEETVLVTSSGYEILTLAP